MTEVNPNPARQEATPLTHGADILLNASALPTRKELEELRSRQELRTEADRAYTIVSRIRTGNGHEVTEQSTPYKIVNFATHAVTSNRQKELEPVEFWREAA